PIPGGLRDGLMVVICGTVLPTCDRCVFKIDLQCGSCPSPHADIALHFNPRFEEGGCVVCNTFERQNWGREERKYEMPFFKGHPFEIRVLVKCDSFQVAVNGNPFVEYKHRIPLSKVNHLSVSGDVDVAIISFQTTAVSLIILCSPVKTVVNICLFVCLFVCLKLGGSHARDLSPVWFRFHVNLKWGDHIALHLNPRFSEKTIVRNSQLHQSWGPEERGLPSGMPLHRGQSFTIWILCDAHCFKVAVNGQHQFEYNHRVPNLQQIDRLEIGGDVTLICVQV
uniref:Galectin n=1 Tax=Chelonoidis abingdonii TaxID=106734 RepID=A0A8C0J2J6_CHEAB